MKRFSVFTWRKLWKPLIISLLFLLNIALVMVPTSAVIVPAQSMFIDPTYPELEVTNLTASETFTVDATVNVTSPTSAAGTGMMGWEYKIFWNSTVVELTNRSLHNPAGWEPPQGFLVRDVVGVWSGGPKDGLSYHWHGYTCLNTSRVFTGFMSLCTYNFTVLYQPYYPEPDYNGTLELWEVKIVDDKAVMFITDVPPTPAGTVQNGTYHIRSIVPPVANFTESVETAYPGQTITFNATDSYDPDGNIVEYFWDFGDGTNTTGMIVDHAYATNGTYTVTLTVTDNDGETASKNANKTILEDITRPEIGDPSRQPEVPDDGDSVTITVDVTDGESGVRNVTISYRTNSGPWTNVSMSKFPGNNTWEGEIPGQSAGTNVTYWIIAYDNAGNPEEKDNEGQYYIYTVIPEFPAALLMPLFMVATLVAVILAKTAWSRKRRSLFVAK